LSETNDGSCNSPLPRIPVQATYKASIDLELSERKGFQSCETGIAGPEIIDRHFNAQGIQFPKRSVCCFLLRMERSFGDFNLKTIQWKTCPNFFRHEPVRHFLMQELTWGNVESDEECRANLWPAHMRIVSKPW
jgi:hypothetical protein